MSKGITTENDVLAYLFNATAMPSYGASAYVSLHTADPGESGTQETNETSYTDYTRMAVVRSTSGWDAPTGGQTANAALIQFPVCGAGASQTITHVVIGTTSTGSGQILYSGALNSSLTVSEGVQPQFAAGALVIEEE